MARPSIPAKPHTPWLRLWCDMPNDPKWRTIARLSQQPIAAVIAVYLHLLVNAANATERGRTENVCTEDIASALDIDAAQADSIMAAMQGRVMDGAALTGWAKRQPVREDGSAERGRTYRERQKALREAEESERTRTQPNAAKRSRTQSTARGEERREEKKGGERASAPAPVGAPPQLAGEYLEFIQSTRPDITTPVMVYANFLDLNPDGKQRTLAKWKVWVRKERTDKEPPSPKADPDSQAAIEAEGIRKGVGRWNGMEQFPAYRARVRAAQEMTA